MFAEQASNSFLSFDDILNNPFFAYGTAPAIYTYLIDTFRNNSNNLVVRGLPEFILANNGSLLQQNRVDTRGGIYEVALGYAGNMNDKFYFGVGVGIPIIHYSRTTYYREDDATGNTNNNFNFFELTDKLTSTGVGFNAKLGVIYKPAERFRLGFTFHTPTIYNIKDNQSSFLLADTEGYNGVASVGSETFTYNNEGRSKFVTTSPYRAILSASYVFNEVADTRKQKAFITADVEYVNYNGTRFNSGEDEDEPENKAYYDGLKTVIKDYYRSNFNFRLGGEIKFNTFMVRAGGGFYGSPYKDKELKSNIIQASGGIGYRDKGIFIDLTYAHLFTKDVNFPYRLEDKANTFATQQGNTGNMMLTFGMKF
jgi:long-subunit fatty acid transport protein